MNETRARCKGKIIGCEKCKDLRREFGYCKYCGRPLDKNPGEDCGIVFAYVKREHVWNGNVKVKCKICKHVNII